MVQILRLLLDRQLLQNKIDNYCKINIELGLNHPDAHCVLASFGIWEEFVARIVPHSITIEISGSIFFLRPYFDVSLHSKLPSIRSFFRFSLTFTRPDLHFGEQFSQCNFSQLPLSAFCTQYFRVLWLCETEQSEKRLYFCVLLPSYFLILPFFLIVMVFFKTCFMNEAFSRYLRSALIINIFFLVHSENLS